MLRRTKVLELPHVQHTAKVHVWKSTVQEVVLAGGIRRAMMHQTGYGLYTGRARFG